MGMRSSREVETAVVRTWMTPPLPVVIVVTVELSLSLCVVHHLQLQPLYSSRRHLEVSVHVVCQVRVVLTRIVVLVL